MKKVLCFLMILVLFSATTYADAKFSSSIDDEVKSYSFVEKNYSIIFNRSLSSNNLINIFNASIGDTGTGYVDMYSAVYPVSEVDSVVFNVYLEKYNGRTYTVISSWQDSPAEKYGRYVFDKRYKVESNNIYRLRVNVKATKGDLVETDSLTTSSITVK